MTSVDVHPTHAEREDGLHPAHRALSAALQRLENLLDIAMGSSQPSAIRPVVDDRAIATQKGRALLELSRITLPSDIEMPVELAAKAQHVRARLIEEQRILKRRMEAAQVIAGLIAEAMMADEWDGTYEPPGAIAGSGPVRHESAALKQSGPRLRGVSKQGGRS